MSAQDFKSYGFLQPAKAQYSEGTAKLLKEMMRESKLSMMQQKQLTAKVKNGESLPVDFRVESAKRPHKARSTKSQPKSLAPARPGIRTHQAIVQSGALERDNSRPIPRRAQGDLEKERLAHMMAYGEDLAARGRQPEPMQLESEPEEEPERDRFEELYEEIEDRRRFLEEMTALGQIRKFKPQIDAEISQKLREMELIDRKRTTEMRAELERADQAAEGGNVASRTRAHTQSKAPSLANTAATTSSSNTRSRTHDNEHQFTLG